MNFKELYDLALSFIFTKRCKYCNTVCDIRHDICSQCTDSICKIEGEICYNCGCSKELCAGKEKQHFYKSICAPFYYEGAAQRAVLNLKTYNTPVVVQSLCADMLACFQKHYSGLDFDCCTFVPIHRSEEKQKHFNHSEILAQALSKKLQIPCYPLLQKDFKTKPQHRLPQMLRSGNLLGTISRNEKINVDITDMRILLIDDIKTTGATLDECTKVLLFDGCAEVRCLTACITPARSFENE